MNEQINNENQFILYLNSLIEDHVSLFIKKRSDCYVDERVLRANAFYAKILFAVAGKQRLCIDQFQNLGLPETDEELYQGALYLYKKWSCVGLADAVFGYCQSVNRLVDHRVFARNKKDEHPLYDFCNRDRDILRTLEKLVEQKA